jgi:hypothetical protein
MTNGGVWMTTAHALDDALSPELEAIATAAHDRLQAQAGQDLSAQEAAQRRVAEAARAAIAAGATLGGAPPAMPRAGLDVHRAGRIAIAVRVRVRSSEARHAASCCAQPGSSMPSAW